MKFFFWLNSYFAFINIKEELLRKIEQNLQNCTGIKTLLISVYLFPAIVSVIDENGVHIVYILAFKNDLFDEFLNSSK